MKRILDKFIRSVSQSKASKMAGLSLLGLLIAPSVFAQTQKWDLTSMVTYAQENSITVKQAQLDEQTASNNQTQAEASRLPSLNMTGSQSLTNGTTTDPITYDFINSTIHSTSLALTAQVTLYSGNQLTNTIKQNELLADQSSLYVAEAKNDIALSVAEGYMQALYYYEGVRVAEENLEASSLELEQSQAKYDAGSIAAKDLAEVKSQYTTAAYNLVTAKNNYQQQVITLKQLLELEPETEFDIAIPDSSVLMAQQIPDKMSVYYQALESMPEIQAANLQSDISALDLKIAKGNYLPSLSMSGSLSTGYTSTQDYSFATQFDNNYSQRVGLSLNIPIFNKLQTKTSVQNAKLTMQNSALQTSSLKKELYSKVENAHQNAVASQAEMEALKAQVESAEATYELTKQQFDLGLVSATDLVVNQNNWIAAKQQLLQTKYRTVLYTMLLKFYEGSPITMG